MARPTQITIDLTALRHNLHEVKKMAPRSAVLAMVKSNAYGHGLLRIAEALADADALGVACIEEGLILRHAGIKNPIVLMEGLFTADELITAVKERFTLIVHHESQVAMLEKSPHIEPLSVWLKIDTGMHRLGFEPSEVQKIHQRLITCAAVKKPIVLMTHFATADSADQSQTERQIDIFNTTTAHLPGLRSLSNSAAIISWPQTHADWVRPGIMLYGASPFSGQCGLNYNLRPVMSLSSHLIAVHQLAKGERIGYGGTGLCVEDMLVGVVAAGYGDGYPQYAKNGTPILVNGKRCPLIGRVSMDMLMVDLRSEPQAQVGDSVILWGSELPVEKIAENNGTSAYELLTRITQRVKQVTL